MKKSHKKIGRNNPLKTSDLLAFKKTFMITIYTQKIEKF